MYSPRFATFSKATVRIPLNAICIVAKYCKNKMFCTEASRINGLTSKTSQYTSCNLPYEWLNSLHFNHFDLTVMHYYLYLQAGSILIVIGAFLLLRYTNALKFLNDVLSAVINVSSRNLRFLNFEDWFAHFY